LPFHFILKLETLCFKDLNLEVKMTLAIKPKRKAPNFLEAHQEDNYFLPANLKELIPPDSPVFALNHIVNSLDLTDIVETYNAMGTPGYPPKTMLKLIIYAYLNNCFSTRKMEYLTRVNIEYMWLAGRLRPEHNTFARFRSKHLAGKMKALFGQVVALLMEKGVVALEEAFIDGTKYEASANRYTFVWKKMVHYQKSKMREQLDLVWDYAQTHGEPNALPLPRAEKLTPESCQEEINEINRLLQNKPVTQNIKK
jgi:transposase